MSIEPLRILVADDEPLASERLALLLARVEGANLVGTAHDGSEAVALAQAVAPDVVFKALGHEEPTEDARWMLRRNGPVWLTFAAAHAVAATRDEPGDWWALAWLRGTEIATDVIWSRSPAFTRPGARAGLWFAGAANVAMALGFGALARRKR